MLPSCGHFKNIPCPFYKLALCVRPHCPYKHQNAESTHQHQLFSPIADETDILFSKVNLTTIGNNSTYHDTVTGSEEKATYIPTPVESVIKPQGILKTSSNIDRASTSYVPEYKPTPISRLKEATTVPVKASKSVYTPEFPLPVKKKKNVEEYDPTEVKVIPKKTVTFVDQTDEATDVPVILISSEDEELDETGDAPQFSDDDFEEETPASKATQQVPEVITIKEDVIVEEEIDPHSVVDKILVDCKKNELLLNSFKRIPPKNNEISANASKPEKNTQKLDQKSDKVHSIKKEKNTSNKIDELNHKSKIKKSETSDSVKDVPSAKSSDNLKKDIKIEKNESSSEKVKKINSVTHSKEKTKKDLKENDNTKHSKKVSHETKKSSSSDSKNVKSDKNSASEASFKKASKKVSENHKVKHVNVSNSPDKNKTNHESSLKSPKTVKSKEKCVSSGSSVKRKSDVSDSDSEQISSKSKSVWEIKKVKKDDSTSPPKKAKSSATTVSNNTKSVNQEQSDSDDDDNDDGTTNDILSSSESDVDPEEECRRIFEECFPEESNFAKEDKEKDVQEEKQPKSTNASDLFNSNKKRLAHPGASEIKPPSKQAKVEVKRHLNPAQVMFNRFAQCKAKFAQSAEDKGGADKKKIIFTPNQGLLQAIKSKNQGNPALGNFNPLPPTVSKTLKITQRTAHVPESAMKPRPIIPADFGSKVPANVRQKFLNGFIDECLKFCESENEAYDLALEEEKKVYDRSSSRPLYLNVAANALKRLRNRAEEGPEVSGNNASSKNSIPSKKTVSHQAMLNGPLAQRRSFSIGRKKEAVEIKGDADLYEYLMPYILTPEQLKENSYPLPHPTEKGRAVIEGAYANRTKYCNDNFKRVCSRCCKTYYVNVDGDYVRDEECDFHWGRLWKKRIAGNFESRYSCCQGDAESDGCCVSPGHVFDGSEAHVLKGYVQTLPKTSSRETCYGIFALDCEMCYTTAGLELTRITVVDSSLKPVYETFVKPLHKVQDYNTRFSGITEDDLKNVRTTIQDVQDVLLLLFNDRTILIGHSLESDFKALKLFHKTVIDTSVVFPHKSGLPYKRALKTLMAEKLNKIIQNDVGGHDSQEDAVACMELMLWKVKEDARGNR